MLLLLFGTYVLELEGKNSLFFPFRVFFSSRKHYYILSALLLFTITSLLDKILVGRYKLSPYAFTFFQQLFTGMIFLSISPLIRKKQGKESLWSITRVHWRWLCFIALVTVIYRYTQIESVRLAPVALVLSVKRLSVFFSTLFGGKFFHESALTRKLSAVCILLGRS